MTNLTLNLPAVVNNIVQWLKDYATVNNMDGFVVGISGGIDSAVVSKLCSMTGLRTVCVLMPISQNKSELDRGIKHVKQLQDIQSNMGCDNVDLVNYDLTSIYQHNMLTLNNIPVKFTDLSDGRQSMATELLARANTRARMRMTTLYYIATKHKLLVAGTGNKVEDFGVGFFTKYGDGGVDISPIADLYKTEVFELARTLGIIKEIQDAKPTDGLWDDGRSDEDQLGATYAELEWAMKYIETTPTYSVEDLEKLSKREREVFGIYRNRHNANKHKMVPIPICEVRNNNKLLKIDIEVSKLMDELKEIRDAKIHFLNDRDYEGAATQRDKERTVIDKLKELGITV